MGSILNLVENVALFLKDYSRSNFDGELPNTVFLTWVHLHTGDLADPNSRKLIMEDFDKLITILKSSFAARKNVGELNPPYTSRYESGGGGTKCTLWPYLEDNFPLTALFM
jgi:hypothetical protein